ncbi:hypothetical protein AWZ03_000793 [Drosophila navojoa]|uniref:Uncharacterized protein n=1 Tax=Drosophila navojoa TaxID=7232 RepID=A0A484BWU9_DRONA|nr:rho GTPase-activating protein 17 [Drosophila navojoa]TDG52560.1 hypothetical protein AWZ03_000793 [Drosophila navojoa]
MSRRLLHSLHLLYLSSWLCLVQGAQVYMELNGQSYSYNTDVAVQTNDLSPNYEIPAAYQQQQQQQHQRQQSQQWPYASTQSLSRNAKWGWLQPAAAPPPPPAPTPPPAPRQPQNFDFSTQHMSHSQHTDDSGIVLGKYSYYDDAGYHELSYKAGPGIGFVVMGGNLAKPTEQTANNLHGY